MKGTIQFRNTRIVNFTSSNEKSGVACWVQLKSDLSRPVCEEMGWGVLEKTNQDGEESVSEVRIIPGLCKNFPLLGTIYAESVKFTPGGSLRNQAIEVLAIRLSDFKVAMKGGGDDEEDPIAEAELRFKLHLPIESGDRVFGYHKLLKDEPALLKVKVSKEAQMKLGEDQEPDGEDEEGDTPEAEKEKSRAGGSLASAREIKATVSER